jgi:outer membrane protein TolC
LPADLPLTLPAELVRQRPDVAAAAGALDVAAANVRAAIAARLPQITLSASAGGNATDFAQMFANGNPFWAAIGAISTPIFHGGTLLKQQRAARDALEGAKAAYKGTALQALPTCRTR